jgi:hypothetical protein
MKRKLANGWHGLMGAAVIGLGVWATGTTAGETKGTAAGDYDLLFALQHQRPAMVRVTEEPFRVVWGGLELCNRPAMRAPHEDHWIHVFISPGGTNAMRTGKGTYPVGTVILKQKFLDGAGTKTDFYTGMRKREAGYNPELGDWEFFALDLTGETVIARGKIESCMDCHSKYAKTDFVSRSYLAKPADANGWRLKPTPSAPAQSP